MNENAHTLEQSQSSADSIGNPFNLQIHSFEGPAPLGPVISRDEFAAVVRSQALIDDTADKAQALLREANLAAAQIRAEAQQAMQARAELIRRDATVSRGLKWLVDEAHFETAVIDGIEARVREMMVGVLKEWSDDQNHLTPLANHLAALVREHARRRPYRIRLHPGECEQVIARLNESLPDGIDCIADAMLDPGQAVIDTEFLRIEFDVTRHWAAVLAALSSGSSSMPAGGTAAGRAFSGEGEGGARRDRGQVPSENGF